MQIKNTLSLKDLMLDIKSKIGSGEEFNVESYVEELSTASGVDVDDVRNIYNTLFIIMGYEGKRDSKRVAWTKDEDELVMSYVRISNSIDSRKPVRDVLSETAEILKDRSDTSIVYRYYNVLTKTRDNIKRKYNKKKSNPKQKKNQDIYNPTKKFEVLNQSENKGDLLDIVVEIIDNVEIAEIDVHNLFNSLLVLSRKAVRNADKEELEQLKKEKAELKEEIKNLTKDMLLLKKEFENFSKMDGKEKIRNIQNLTNRVNYIVDSHGNVMIK